MTKQYRPLLYVAIGLLVVATGFAATFGFLVWTNSGRDSDVARTREEVSTYGWGAVQTLSSLDANRVDEVYQRFLDVSTGSVHDDYLKNADSFKKRIRDSKVVTTALVKEIAVQEVNLDKKQATLLAVVEATVREAEKDPYRKLLRLEAVLDQTDNGWKVSGLREVPYAATAQ